MAKPPRLLRFEVPFSLADPLLVRPELGIERVLPRGRDTNFTMEMTLLDTPDNRLLRAGVMLAHRVVDGLGEWYLDAPDWEPWLPSDRAEPLGADGDLPDEFASLVRPFRRSAPIGPVAALTCRRVEWAVLGVGDELLAEVRDDRLTVRRGGVTIGRHREVTIKPAPALTRAQRAHLAEALVLSGGTSVPDFPSITERLGAPATGLTDFGAPREWDDEFTLEGFVSWLLARRLTKVLRADLALRSGQEGDGERLRRQVEGLGRELRSLSFALDPQWRAGVESDIDAVLRHLPGATIHQMGDEYFRVLDALVLAVRAPRLGDHSQQLASSVLRQQLVAASTILFDRARSLNEASPNERWAAALASANQLASMVQVSAVLFGRRAKQVGRAVAEAAELLAAAQAQPNEADPQIDQAWSPVQAFEAGRAHERLVAGRTRAREEFVAQWPAIESRIRRAKVGS